MILAIDPGPINSAYVIWDGSKIVRGGIEHNTAEINFDGMDLIACEHIQCFGMAVGKHIFETAYWIGEFRREARLTGIKFVPVYRSQVKMHLCGSMRAKDSNIRQCLIDRFGPPGTKKAPGLLYGVKGDLWSALAIAVTVQETYVANDGAILEKKCSPLPLKSASSDVSGPRFSPFSILVRT